MRELQVQKDRLATVRRIYAALADGDLDAIAEHWDPEIECVLSDEAPMGGVWRGRERATVMLRDYLAQYESFHVDVAEFFVCGDTVVAIGNAHGRTVGGGNLWQPFAHVLKLRDGRVAHFAKYADTTKELRAFGRFPAGA